MNFTFVVHFKIFGGRIHFVSVGQTPAIGSKSEGICVSPKRGLKISVPGMLLSGGKAAVPAVHLSRNGSDRPEMLLSGGKAADPAVPAVHLGRNGSDRI